MSEHAGGKTQLWIPLNVAPACGSATHAPTHTDVHILCIAAAHHHRWHWGAGTTTANAQTRACEATWTHDRGSVGDILCHNHRDPWADVENNLPVFGLKAGPATAGDLSERQNPEERTGHLRFIIL